MPTRTTQFCDVCGKEIEERKKLLIYSIKYWNKKHYKEEERDYLKTQDEAAMFCGTECVGVFIYRLLNGVDM